MENPEEILHSLEEFSKMKPKDIPRELEEYLCFVAKTGNPVYQWPTIKSLFREKLLNVITEFYESCPSVDIPPCRNVEMFNYDLMKNFILEKLDTFAAAPFTVQRICELLTTPRKEYNRIDKYMRALEKNILVVSTTEPGRRSTENGEGIMNGIESEHLPESSNSSHDINVEEMDESPSWPRAAQVAPVMFDNSDNEAQSTTDVQTRPVMEENFENVSETKIVAEIPTSSTVISTQPQVPTQQETVITCRSLDEAQHPYVSIEPVPSNACTTSHQEPTEENQADASVTITAVPTDIQQRRNSVERLSTVEKVEDVKESSVTENVEEKHLVLEKEESAKEQISSSAPCPEPIVEPVIEAKLVAETEEVTQPVREESGIENISPENSSSSPEALHVDVNSEQEKPSLEGTENTNTTEQSQSEDKEEALEIKEPEVELGVQQECVDAENSLTDLKQREEDVSSTESSSVIEENIEEKIENTLSNENSNDAEEDSSVDSSKDLVIEEQNEVKSSEPEEVPVSETEDRTNEETPMEVDIDSEIEVEKKEEVACEKPSSTSDDSAL